MKINRFKELIYKYQGGHCTSAELLELYQLLNDDNHSQWLEEIYDQLPADDKLVSNRQKDRVLQQIRNDPRVQEHNIHTKRKSSWLYYSAAVISLLITGAFLFYYTRVGVEVGRITPLAVVPGHDRALIELNDGRRFQLDSLSDTEALKEKGFYLSKQDDHHMLFKYHPDSVVKKSGVHTLSTPRGGQFKLELPDGTKIWMNAESTLRFAGDFGDNTRDIICEGEVYFEVAQKMIDGKLMPFTVSTKGQHLTVLGTTFNVNSYTEKIITTLVEGSVSLTDRRHQSVRLARAQQSVYSDGFAVQDVDPIYATAWKNGDFAFQKSTISEVMQHIERWYDVQVKYEGDFANDKFSGTLSRYEDIDKLLKTMELTGSFHFTREGRVIIVKKYTVN